MKNKSLKNLLILVTIVSMVLLSFGVVNADEVSTDSNKTDPVNLGTAGNYAILAKTGISTVPNSVITGDIAVSPIASTAITGFSLTQDATNEFSTSTQIIGKAYAANYASPTPSKLTTAVGDMQTAFTDAAGRAPDYTELYTGDISGQTLTPGVYKWGTGVLINADVTLNGGPNDVFIFQISKGITQAAHTKIILSGGVQAKNIFWQSCETVAIKSGAHFEGIILGKTNITLGTLASINGRLLAQTAVTLIMNTVVAPAVTAADIADITNLIELKAALADLDIDTINVTASFNIAEQIIINRAVTINGGNKIIMSTGEVALLANEPDITSVIINADQTQYYLVDTN